jgi:hypothetical protein
MMPLARPDGKRGQPAGDEALARFSRGEVRGWFRGGSGCKICRIGETIGWKRRCPCGSAVASLLEHGSVIQVAVGRVGSLSLAGPERIPC